MSVIGLCEEKKLFSNLAYLFEGSLILLQPSKTIVIRFWASLHLSVTGVNLLKVSTSLSNKLANNNDHNKFQTSAFWSTLPSLGKTKVS